MANNITLSYPSAFYHQFLDKNGKPLTGGKLYTYSAGTSTPIPTYKTICDTSSANTNTNPIILDNAGMAYIVIETDKAYKFVLFDKNDAKIAEWDNVTGNIGGGGGGGSEDIVVVGTPNEIDVSGSVTQGVKRYVVSLSNSVKSTILYLVGLYNNVLNSLANKADKVQGATAGNLAALDASGNLTDSGSKSADFKTKQTPVTNPSASGAGLDFIDSVSQNANGEITPHKKSVQDGTTAQKGVVKLSNAIDSTSVTEAATPKAIKDAYDELNNKIVARAVFLSQAEWAVQSQLQGDPAKVYYVENGTGEDAYTVYVWKESTSTYEEVDESSIDLDGYWHDSPTTTGSGNVVTNITIGNDGVPQIEKGMSAEPAFSVLPIAKGGTGAGTIKGALSTLTSETQHYDTLPTDDTLIVHKFGAATASNGALYTRKLSYLWTYIQNKISSVLGLTASSYDGKAATAGAADTASAAASGSALESAIDGKVNKPIQIGATSSKPWVRICSGTVTTWNSVALVCKVYQRGYANVSALNAYVGNLIFSIFRQNDSASYPTIRQLYIDSALQINYSGCSSCILHDGLGYYELWIRCATNEGKCSILEEYSYDTTIAPSTAYTDTEFTSYITDHSYTRQNSQYHGIHLDSSGVTSVGSTTTPVYVKSDGTVAACTQGATLKSNTATLYIAGYTGNNIPYYHVKDIKNGCVNHVDFSGITNSTCDITFEAPTLSTGEEYDYIISLEGYTNNSGYSTGPYVENCKQVLRYDYVNNLWIGEPLFLQATDWRQICVVRGNTCEWKRVTLS